MIVKRYMAIPYCAEGELPMQAVVLATDHYAALREALGEPKYQRIIDEALGHPDSGEAK